MSTTNIGLPPRMEGLPMTDELRAAELRALQEELEGVESKITMARESHEDAETRERRVSRLEKRADAIREQQRIRGAEGAAPHRRAAKRGQPGAETR